MAETVQFVDLTQFNSGSKGFSGAIFDGRYLYLAPLSNGKGLFHGDVARYDSRGEIQDASSWTFFDTATLNSNSRGFVDGIFDGRYLYLIPYHHDRHHGQVTRYDTRVAFDDPGAWTFFDLQKQLNEKCRGFVSGSFDGRYLYLSPYHLDWETHHGRMARYDTESGFLDADSWQSFDSQTLWPESRGFHSAVSASGRTWFVPYVRENRDYHGLLVQNSQADDFTDPQHWQSVDLTTFHPGACGYVGGCYDGRFFYLAPYYNGHERHGLAARLDTDKPLDAEESWEFFDMTSIDAGSRGFFGAIHHEDYIYFLPHCREEGIYHGQFSRYDRRLSFDDPKAWSVLDTAALHPKSMGFMGGVVIAGHLVMAPYETAPFAHSGIVARLNLGQPSAWNRKLLNDSSHVN